MNNPKELRLLYAYQFGGPNIGIDIPKGWFQIVAKLCKDIDILLGDDKKGFHWTQVKEKFGTGRFHWVVGKTEGPLRIDLQSHEGVFSFEAEPKSREKEKETLMKEINQLVNQAQAATGTVCIVCGTTGELDRVSPYVLTLCPRHTTQRRHSESSMESPWFGEEER